MVNKLAEAGKQKPLRGAGKTGLWVLVEFVGKLSGGLLLNLRGSHLAADPTGKPVVAPVVLAGKRSVGRLLKLPGNEPHGMSSKLHKQHRSKKREEKTGIRKRSPFSSAMSLHFPLRTEKA